MKTKTLFAVLATVCMCCFRLANAGEGDLLWSHSYGGPGDEMSFSVIPTGDGGFFMAGSTNSYGAGDYDVWLMKVNAQGDSVWSRTYGNMSGNLCWSLISAGDGGFLLAGLTEDLITWDQDMSLMKVDSAGNLLWWKSYGGIHDESAYCMIPSGDGGYMLAGLIDPNNNGIFDMCLLKVNAQGDSLWMRTYGGSQADWALSMTSAGDGGYLITGCTESYGAGLYDVWLVKVNAQGDMLWSKTYGYQYCDWASAIIPDGQGNFLLAGRNGYSIPWGWYDVYLIKVNAEGDTLWTRSWGGSNYEEAFDIMPSGDGCFILAGQTASFGAGMYDYYLLKVNTAGDTLWARTYGGPLYEGAQAVTGTSDGDFIVAGASGPDWLPPYDFCLMKVQGPEPPPVHITLVPLNPPITIPAIGGSFSFTATLSNDTLASFVTDVWMMVRMPDQSWYGPATGPLTFTMQGNTSLTRLRTQNVPATAPAGQYWYEGRVGDYPATVWDTSGFAFTKLGFGGSGLELRDWSCSGEPFPGEEIPSLSRGDRGDLVAISPNPFNPTTAISYKLQATSQVSLKVYDTAGRLVETLVAGMQAAGQHSVTFDGSELASGLYFVRLQAGDFTAVEKIMLIK